MNKGISVAFLILGISLLIFGGIAVDSFSSDVSRFFTGAPTDKSIWLLIAGAVSTLIALPGLFRRPHNS